MSEIDDILSQIPLGQIAGRLGVDQGQAEAATRAALPALLGGLQANAQDPAGAASLAGALQQHDGGLLGSDLDAVDTHDGQKIVGNIFGDQTDQVVSRLGGVGGTGGSAMMQQLLPMLAPYVLAFLAKRLQGSGGLGDLLGSVLGGAAGGAGTATTPAGGGGLGDILGGILGGGSTASGQQSGGLGGGLGDLLGGLLGGGKKA